VFVFTPTHGSWLNLIEGQFSKMTRTMLRGTRVASKKELVDRIHQYFADVNSAPVVFRWKYRMDDSIIV
jgi:transposase